MSKAPPYSLFQVLAMLWDAVPLQLYDPIGARGAALAAVASFRAEGKVRCYYAEA